MKKNQHLTLDERYKIKSMLDNNDEKVSFKSIGRALNRDCTTISKEIKNHIVFKKTGSWGHNFNDCINRFDCSLKGLCTDNCNFKQCSNCSKCYKYCKYYAKQTCKRLNKPPYVCNGCPDRTRCSLEKHLYEPIAAQREYELLRSESRSGICLTEEDIFTLNEILYPLINNGQSIHHIVTNNKSKIMLSEKSIYNYIENGILANKNIDLPRKVRYRPRKSKHDNFKVDKACRITRTYEDFLSFIDETPYCPIVEMDSVEGKRGGKVLLTIHFVKCELMLAFIRDRNTAYSVEVIFNRLYKKLGIKRFKKLFPVLIGDNGSEFSDPKSIEYNKDGKLRTRVFYCDASKPYQKGACENNHEFIRRILPKGTSFDNLTQQDVNLMMSHINSYSRPTLGDITPIEAFESLYGSDILETLGIRRIPANDIVLNPKLLK